eukprot:TRINITY_DN13326_c0_g1_i3.p2 TRINITY_DN13326_c0_g1~~TRINITY_DN13326_c0_g1_i3.p2  ORF type:complete len:148 (-),score=24.32 TRINITY_DN13326_c0_g1_i3:254-697(-)
MVVQSVVVQPRVCYSLRRSVPLQARNVRGVRTIRRADVPSNPLFSDEFKKALEEALSREGMDALTGSQGEQVDSPPPMGAAEEVLLTAVAICKQNLARLVAMENEIDAVLEKERAQLNRLQFALKKAVDDRAFQATLEKRIVDLQKK